MAATNGIILLKVSRFEDGNAGFPLAGSAGPDALNLTPLILYAATTSASTIKVYLGGANVTSGATVTLKWQSLDGTVKDSHTTSVNSDTTSVTYTTTNTDAWLATAGVTFKLWAEVTYGGTEAPGASALKHITNFVYVTTN